MKKLTTLILHNLKKDKGSYLSFSIIILMTAFMLNLALVLAFQVDKAYDAKFEELDTASINFCILDIQDTNEIENDLLEIEGIEDIEKRSGIFATAVVKDFRETDFSMNTVFYNMDEERRYNKLEINEEVEIDTENSIVVPLYVASFGEFALDDEIVYEIDGEEYTFQVAGIVEEMQYGNYGIGLMGAYLPDEAYQKFSSGKEANKVVEYSLVLKENADYEIVNREISDLLKADGITMLTNSNSEATKQTRTMVCNLLILILMAFAVVILLVSVFLCKFRIQNAIEDEMINMGVLKAIGYTSSMIMGTMVCPYLFAGIFAALIGVIISYSILPTLSDMLALQSGFSFVLDFDAGALVISVCVLLAVIVLFTYRAARGIRKLQPINAIRGNGEGKHVKKNHLPLDVTAGNIQILLMLKQIFISAKQNVLLFFVSFVLTILVAFAGTLFYNVIIEPDNFMTTLSEEMPDVIIQPEGERIEELQEVLQRRVLRENVLQYMIGTVELGDLGITVFACEDFSAVSNDLCYAGRNPQTEDEIAVGSAFAGEYEIGDTVVIRDGEISHTYEVVGFVQSVNYQGKICELTIDGYDFLKEEKIVPSLYVYLQEDEEAESFLEKLEEEHEELIQNSVNYAKTIETSQEMYAGLTSVIIAVIFVLTILIVVFILYIVMKSLITQRKQEFGIYKAMGYSSRQLILQMAGSFLPIVALAVLVSSVLALFYMPWMNQFIFQTVGAIKNNMEVSISILMLFAVALITATFAISIFLAMPIRRISAYSLIKE